MNSCWLVKNGVPFHLVFCEIDTLLPHEQFAMQVVFAGFEGNQFDWSAMRYAERKSDGV
ncbi:hypothetical protein [Chromobacterium violaceum]|uniref:hypothetical protein n=1 Tax=Chromobacterium violaceum TaxID=536 RepID=UPI001595971B|nr:hypothetical protein [Chromobacterium violaceum]